MGTRAAAIVRLVSKSWYAAFGEVAAPVHFRGKELKRLEALRKILPQMKELRVYNARERLGQYWAAELSYLTCLSLIHDGSFYPEGASDCTLSSLPTSLNHLLLDGINVVPEPADKIKLRLLTKVELRGKENVTDDAGEWLLCLPKLKVSHPESSCTESDILP